jgi:glycerophosphoryl diester phosphodiesterase
MPHPARSTDTRYSILDPPTHPILPADDADNADRDPDFLRWYLINLRDLRESKLNVSIGRPFTGRLTFHLAATGFTRKGQEEELQWRIEMGRLENPAYNRRPMNKLFFACAAMLVLMATVVGAGDRPTTIHEFYDASARTRVIAHRGFSGAAPENTIAAVKAAIELGADMAEIDVTLTADGHIVVIHDETLDRTTNGSGEVFRYSLAELQQLDAGSWFDPSFAGERIPTLDEVLSEVDDRILLNVEIKSEAVERGVVSKVASEIREHRMVDQVVVSSFSPTALQELHSSAPEIRTAVLYNTKFHKGQDAVEIVNDLEASVFNIKRQRLTRKMLRRCRENEIPVGIYTVNKPRRMRRLVKKGIDAIFTDHPDRLIDVLNPAPTNVPAPTPIPAAVMP